MLLVLLQRVQRIWTKMPSLYTGFVTCNRFLGRFDGSLSSRKTRYRGLEIAAWVFTFTDTGCNLVERLPSNLPRNLLHVTNPVYKEGIFVQIRWTRCNK